MKSDMPLSLISQAYCAECNDTVDIKSDTMYYKGKLSNKYHYPLCDGCQAWMDEEEKKDEEFEPAFVKYHESEK